MRALKSWLRTVGCAWLLVLVLPALGQPPTGIISNLVQLASAATPNPTNFFQLHFEALVLWSHPAENLVALTDSSGIETVELAAVDRLQPGHVVQFSGNATVSQTASGVRIGSLGAVVQNDGVHSMIEKSGSVYLPAGLNAIRLDWFNGLERSGLEVEWSGPGIDRQKLDETRLRTSAAIEPNAHGEPGLNFRGYEGTWEVLPEFDRLTSVKTGRTPDIDLSVAPRNDRVGLSFSGWLDVPADGLYTFWLRSDDGSQLFVGGPTVRQVISGSRELPAPTSLLPGQILSPNKVWVRVDGTVVYAAAQSTATLLELRFGPGKMRVIVPESSLAVSNLLNRRVAVTGVCVQTITAEGHRVAGLLLAAPGSVQLLPAPEETGFSSSTISNRAGVDLPTLTSAAAVHGLKREEAQRRFPVRLRGVITSVLREHQAFTIQDASRGLYVVDFSSSRPMQARLGEFLEVEGVTDPSLFAPVVNAQRVRSLGQGQLPDPVRATWDQLVNGSLDAQYVELQGIVTDVQTNRLTLRLPGGIIRAEIRLAGAEVSDLRPFENALVRIRGCLFASWDYVTHEVKPGEVRVYSATIAMDAAPPGDLFSIRPKSVSDLRLFDPQASVFQRVKVMGQLVHLRENEGYLLQGDQGVRFVAREPMTNALGDLLELVGFPDVSGPAAPVLHESLARKVGMAPLPEPRRLRMDETPAVELDGLIVRLEGTLVSIRQLRGEALLEIQSGVRRFLARSANDVSQFATLVPGSRLELAGVFAAQVSGKSSLSAGSFELLLRDRNSIRVLARPPWWTLERLLLILGILAAGLAVTALWITQLHRKVERRTAELGAQIQARQRVEHQREMELERSRIARDLHDELGSGITEIGMLAARSKSALTAEERRAVYLEQMGAKARELVTALDEIVWAMNPKHDSLGSLISYFSLYADRFLGLAGIPWKLDVSGAADQTLNSRHRHQLFLAFKEALNNVVRHSAATKVNVAIRLERGRLELSISDNGRGLPATAGGQGMDGVANMRDRMERLGGSFETVSSPERGTTLRFVLPGA